MAIHGETVGEAYIRLRSDGSSLPREFREDFDRANPDFERAGGEHAKAYNKAFDDEIEKHQKDRNLIGTRTDINRQRGRMEATGRLLADDFDDGFIRKVRASLNRNFGRDIGQRVFRGLDEEARKAGNFDAFKRGLADLAPRVHAATNAIRADEQRLANFQNNLRRTSLQNAINDNIEQSRLRQKALADARAKFAQQFADARNLNDRLVGLARQRNAVIANLNEHAAHNDKERFDRLIHDATNAARRGDSRLGSALIRDTEKFIREGEHGFVRLNGRIRQGVREVDDMDRHFGRLEGRIRRVGDTVGRAFGRGSRNNFVNFIGALARGLTTMGALFALRLIRGPLAFAQNLKAAWKEGDTFGAKMKNIGSVLGGTLLRSIGRVGKGLIGLFGGLNLVALIAGPLAALISMLAGAIVALSSTIILGLIGAIGPLIPLLGVFAVGIGVVALAFAKMGASAATWKAQLQRSLAPVTDQFKQLQQVARENLFGNIDKQAPMLATLLNRISPIVAGAARGISDAWTNSLKVLNGPEFEQNFASLQHFIPGAMRKLGTIFTNVFGQITGVMRALVPLATQWLNSLVKSSTHWLEFINSTEGQNKIADFFDRAYKSAQVLWRFTKDLIKVIGDLLDAGQNTGDTIFEKMADQLERFDKFLNTTKGRQETLAFFKDVESFFQHLGNGIVGLAHMFDSLDNATSRGQLGFVLDTLGKIGDALSVLFPIIEKFQAQFFHQLGDIVNHVLAAAKPLVPLAKQLLEVFGGALITGVKALKGPIDGVLNAIQSLTSFIASHEDTFKTLAALVLSVWGAFKGFAILKAVGVGFSAFVGAIPRFGSQLQSQLSRVAGIARTAGAGISAGLVSGLVGGQVGGDKGIGIGIAGGAAGGLAVGGPWGAAVGALIGGLTAAFTDAGDRASDAAAEMTSNVGGLTDALIADKGALGENTQEWIRHKLVTSGVLDSAKSLGLSFHTITAAVGGSKGAMDQLDAALKDQINTQGKVDFAALAAGQEIKALAVAYGNATSKAKQDAIVRRIQKAAMDAGTDSAVANTRAFNSNAGAVGRLTAKIRTLTDAYLALVSARIAQAQSEDEFLSGLQSLSKALKDNNGQLGIHTQKARDDRDQFLSVAQGAISYRKAMIDATGDTKAANQVFADNISKLSEQAIKAGASKRSVEGLLSTLGLMPKKIETLVEARTDTAQARLRELLYLAQQVEAAHPTLHVGVTGGHTLTDNGIPMATGTIVTGYTRAIIGEAGPEAVVPLRRPLSQVDPSVRWLSAIAQGKTREPRMASGGIATPSRQVVFADGSIRVVTPTTDPVAVAAEVVNRIAAGGYG